jgi:twinkle protein
MLKMESKFLKHEACPKCGSKNNLARYTDGHAHCFTPDCGYYEKAEGVATPMNNTMNNDLYVGQTTSLKDRGISQETASKYGVTTLTTNGMITKHVYPFYNSQGKHVANKIRTLPKEFTAQGNFGECELFGQNLFTSGQKYITVTEGECDAMAVFQMMGSRYASVSIKNGVQSAVRDCKQNFEYLNSFDNIIICFDSDNIGRETANKVSEIFPPNKCKIVNLELKDANEYLKAGKREQFTRTWWDAKPFTPAGIVCYDDIIDEIVNDDEDVQSCLYPYQGLNEKLYGLRVGELVTLTSGTGMGKSSFMRELVHHIWKTTKDKIGLIFLEEERKRTFRGLISILQNKEVHKKEEWNKIPIEERRKWAKQINGDENGRRLFAFDHWGSMEDDAIINRIRYMANGCDCKWIFVDHLSLIHSGRDDGNERKAIDILMTKLRSLCHETKVGMILACHLKRLDGDKGHEEGKQVSLSHLRGSHAIAQLSDAVIGMERNQQEEDDITRNTSIIRVLKNRYAGITGVASYLLYSNETGRMTEIENPFKEKDNDNETN